MYYTREPIIESVITPKEGNKLIIRNSKKGVEQEEFSVDAIEIVNFGNAVFYRSTERPQSFLVPVVDYEVIEVKENKMVLKSAGLEKVKIGGSKNEEKSSSRKRKAMKKRQQMLQKAEEEEKESQEEEQVSSSILRKLFPPPPNLIKEKLNNVKSPDKIEEKIEEGISQEIVKEEIIETKAEAEKELPKEKSSDKSEEKKEKEE